LGAGRGRIVRQLLTEGFVLALLGGAFGVLLALWSSDLLVSWLGKMVPVDIVVMTGPSAALLAATFGFCLLGTLFFGLGPALKLSRATALDDLKEHAGEDVSRRRWKFLPRNPLVVVQIGFSLALITTAALFIRGARTAANIDTGLNTERLFLVEVDASLRGYDRAHTQQLYRTLGEKLAALPGVESASISSTVPFGMFGAGKRVQRAGSPPPAEAKPWTAADDLGFSEYRSVGADYFKTTGLPLLRGRTFTAAEATQPGGPAVAIIDDKLAQQLWPEGDALGQRVQFAAEIAATADSGERSGAAKVDEADGQIRPGESIEVVGIVPHTRNVFFEEGPENNVYVPFSRGFQSNVYFLAKFSSLPQGSEASAADLLRPSIMSVDAELPIISIKTFEQHLNGNLQLWLVNAGAALFSIFGALALGLAVVGVYGVKAYSVARRTREIGIRMALGAEGKTVQWMILREGFAMVAAGLAIGLLLAFATGKMVSSILFDVSSTDPFAFTFAPSLLALAALLATWLPARRATRISPMAALRTE
jgi:predicted permease